MDEKTIDKVRIWGRTFGGGNSCNVGIWDGTADDNAEVYADDATSWHPGDNFQGDGTIKINIGSHVQFGNRNDSHETPNGLFMGSNGESLKYDAFSSNNYIGEFEELNDIDLATDVTDWSKLTEADDKELYGLSADLRKDFYPNLLSVYMRAVDMKALPQGFSEFSGHTFTNTWIGDFCMGGNAGSMMIDQPIDIVFPQSLNLFGRIIGGCRDASFHYKGKWHRGGFRMPLAAGATLDGQPTKAKLRMKIRGDWYSRRMVMKDQYKTADTYSPDGDYLVIDKTDDGITWKGDGKAWHDGCNVYGGCYESGDMIGDVQIYIESDMLAYSDERYAATIDTYTNPQLDESNRLHLPVANIYGAGFGTESRNFGDAYIYMKDIPDNKGTIHPSVNNIFGGGRNGMLVGNSVIHVHDGLVYKDVVGGSFAAPLYGSSQVTVGYPKFYVCKKTGEYFLDRGDKWNEGYKTKGNNSQDDVIKKSIKYFKGTYVPCNVYDQIKSVKVYTNDTAGSETSIGDYLKTNKEKTNDYFEFHDESADASIFPKGGWDNVEIRVRGGIYGGGYSLSNSTSAVAGSYTTLASTDKFNHGEDSKGNSSVGFGGNSSVIISDYMGTPPKDKDKADVAVTKSTEHIKISTSNSGGVFGDGRLVFCEGFRAAEINGYGYATRIPDGVVTYDSVDPTKITSDTTPLELNTLQRFDLLTLNDCCMVLDGDPDFAADQMDGRPYSMARIGELRMNSSINPAGALGTKRNYIGFKNNVHYLGAIVTNDDFENTKFHADNGNYDSSNSYKAKKNSFITAYNASDKQSTAVDAFKQRNVGTARNMVGLNSGYYLRIENQYYDNGGTGDMQTYYGPIVGVCEVKLNNVQPGEGGGYIYADNIHAETNHFLNTSGNFVFPGRDTGEKDSESKPIMQYIVDDCFMDHFGTPDNLTNKVGDLDKAHYWYIEGNKYFYNTTLTALSSNHSETFNLTKNDPNVIFAGIEEGSTVTLESVQWQPATYPTGYSSDIRGGRDDSLTPLAGSSYKYKFTLQVGDEYTWSQNMPRSTTTEEQITGTKPSGDYQAAAEHTLPTSPQFNVQLIDNVNNCPEGSEADYYAKHLSVPEQVKIVIKSVKDDVTKTYNVTLDIMYVQGPSYTGNVVLHNCALPGEFIDFSSSGITIQTTDQLPVTEFGWKLVEYKGEVDGKDTWYDDDAHTTSLPAFYYTVKGDETVEGRIPALYRQNKWNIAYTFKAGGQTFTVLPQQDKVKSPKQENRMLVVHNYHRMKDVKSHDRDLDPQTGACVYIEDEEDLRALIDYLNLADKQDFNAPIAFTVNDRIWYERQPQTFRNVTGGYGSSTGWEGICLPFTAQHVVASENGEISHFYGTDPGSDGVDSGSRGSSYSNKREVRPPIDTSLETLVDKNDHTLHHEYWLAGFCEAQTTDDVTYATFSRPSTAGEGLFTDPRQVHDTYTYPSNTYFTGLPHYTDYYDAVDGDDHWARTDAKWYASNHNFADYVYLTASVPYLIAFPGNDFYEFSIQGTDYVPASHTKTGDAQWVTYSASNFLIGVSDDETKRSDVNGHRYQGTYLNHPVATYNVLNATGTAFESATTAILPFRTYMTTTASSQRRIVIKGYYNDDDNDEDGEDFGDLFEPTLSIYGEGTTVVVESNYNTELRVYSTAGRLVKTLSITAGTNRYPDFRPDIYIVGGRKLRLFP